MGCDIHIYTERKRNNEWRCTDYFTPNEYYGDEGEPEFDHKDFYDGRDYELFGAIAGVRREYDNSAKPKGFPDNASKECKRDYNGWGCDAHTPSYLNLKELKELQLNLNDKTKRSGMISPEQATELDGGKSPESWCGWTSRTDHVHREWEVEKNQLDFFMEKLTKFLEGRFYNFELKGMDDPDLRVVFWFDN
ncbi:hypothetical protein KAR91_46460 [Candidatus Pacearchaeota archaeon]|nr:hypothetical protein [Candidatus Pacearchaeota archaeon]